MRTPIIAFCTLLLLSSASRADPVSTSLSSRMMDRAIYRDGQVQRLAGQFGAWTVVCDEIISLKQRYCSLRSATLQTSDGRSAYVDVSTGDDGQPAALLHLPLTVSVAFGANVAPSSFPGKARSRKGRSRLDPQRKLAIVTCSDRECLSVWSLRASEIQALNAGHGLTITFCTTSPGTLEFATNLRSASCQAKFASLLPSTGFHEAIQASVDHTPAP